MISGRLVLVGLLFDESCSLQALQPIGQDVRRDPLGGVEKLLIKAFAQEEITNNDKRPFVADHVKGIGDRANRTFKARCGPIGFRVVHIKPLRNNLILAFCKL